MLSQRQSNVILSVKPMVIYNPDVYRKWTNLFLFSFSFFWGWGWGRNYCFLIKSPLWWWVWLFQANVDDKSQNRCWFRVEQIETGNSSVAKISNGSGVKLPMWKIALTVMMLFYLLLRLKLSFTSNASTDASFPSTCSPVLCCVCCGGWCSVLRVCTYWKNTVRTGPKNFSSKKRPQIASRAGVIVCSLYLYILCWSKL